MEINHSDFKEYYAWLQPSRAFLPAAHVQGDVPSAASFAREELMRGLSRIGADKREGHLIISYTEDASIAAEGYRLKGQVDSPGISIAAADPAGFIYGTYELLSQICLGSDPRLLDKLYVPRVPHRVLNHWDNTDGSIERGYSGKSLFFRGGHFCYDRGRIEDYARLLASIKINEISINNVNVDSGAIRLITENLLPEVAEFAGIFRPFGIRLQIAVDFESPEKLGGLKTSDPLDESVISWWNDTAALVYRYIPDIAGFLVKADSEFRSGPSALGRTQADGANMLADALAKHGGKVYWRCFVYNCEQDWRDTGTDRPKAAFENFAPLDGKYHDGVILQVKNGPLDFQVREPVSPLFGQMKHTGLAVEFQVTQEYTGQQIDLYALAVAYEEFFAARVRRDCSVSDLTGSSIVAVAGVSNTGGDENWTGHLLAQANLYAFGCLAWNPELTAKEITDDWVRLTFGGDPELSALTDMMLSSRSTYEKYTSPLGLGFMVNTGNHYGPSPEGYEFMKWGTYHRADRDAIGVDRTKNGTGFTSQYDPWLDEMYSNPDTCPEELVLFFHRLRYDFRLKSGKTLLQHIYDTHFEGAEEVKGFIGTWERLKEYLPASAYSSVLGRLQRQLSNAVEWRDVINTYFFRKTGIADEKGREIFP